MTNPTINEALSQILDAIERLRQEFGARYGKKFTIDGRLVGDLGEVLAALNYDLQLDEKQGPDHDGRTSDGRLVQVKATFKNSLAFRTEPDYCLGLKLREDGGFEEVFNGPGSVIFKRFGHLKDIGQKQKSFPLPVLRLLSKEVDSSQRIPKRE